MLLKNTLHLINQKEQELKQLYQQLNSYPKGTLHINKNGKYTKWFYENEEKLTYLPKSNRQLAELLAQKQFILSKIHDLSNQLPLLNNYYEQLANNSYVTKLLSNSEIQSLLSTYHFKDNSWNQEEYSKNTFHPENLVHKSISGNCLRSKSEVIIDMSLYMNRIPFRYECELILQNKKYYPDFTIKHPETGELFYWEHFGKMDSPDYIRDACRKIQVYSENGIIPTINLITTYETSTYPLNADVVDQIIKQYFL